MFVALSSAVVIGLWAYDSPFGPLALFGVLLLALLWRMRTPPERVERP